jgi:hypothetical protein
MKRLIAACLAVLLLAACGDDKPAGPATLEDIVSGRSGMPGGLSGLAPGSADAWKQAGTIELTDDLMQSYVDMLERMKELNSDSPDTALLAAYSLDRKHWGAITAAIARSALVGAKPAQQAMLEKQLEGLRKRHAEAPPNMKDALAKQIEAYEKTLSSSVAAIPDATELDRKNQAVIERWMERIRDAGR